MQYPLIMFDVLLLHSHCPQVAAHSRSRQARLMRGFLTGDFAYERHKLFADKSDRQRLARGVCHNSCAAHHVPNRYSRDLPYCRHLSATLKPAQTMDQQAHARRLEAEGVRFGVRRRFIHQCHYGALTWELVEQ